MAWLHPQQGMAPVSPCCLCVFIALFQLMTGVSWGLTPTMWGFNDTRFKCPWFPNSATVPVCPVPMYVPCASVCAHLQCTGTPTRFPVPLASREHAHSHHLPTPPAPAATRTSCPRSGLAPGSGSSQTQCLLQG